MKALRYRLEAWGARLLFALFGLLPVDAASAIGGWLARLAGPHLRVSDRARRNLARAMPDLSGPEIERIVANMWDNIGRTAAELPHLAEFTFDGPDPRIRAVGAEHYQRFRDDGATGVVFSAHYGNWEVLSLTTSLMHVPVTYAYRAANNPLVEEVIQALRAAADRSGVLAYVPKGSSGARELIAAMKAGRHVGMLVDQKMNDGIPVPFFGRDAMTATAPAQLALKYRCPVLPARIVRLGGARFRVDYFPPIALPDSGDRQADIAELMRRINALIESWVREHPDHWFWLHRRWPD